MPGYLGKYTNDPRDITGQQAQSAIDNQWGPIPGEIVSYDPATGTATVKPLYKPRHNGEPVEMPELYEVPVDQPRTASAGLTMPIPAGTKVMLTPQMRAFDDYEEGGDAEPFDARAFHISNMRASLAGGDSLSSPLPNADPDNTHLRFDPDGLYGLKGSPDGKMKLEGSQGDVYALLTEVADLAKEGFEYLSAEPQLVHTGEYASIASQLNAIVTKLEGMQL